MKKEKGRIPLSEAQLGGDGLFGGSQMLHPFLGLVQAAVATVKELAWLLGRASVEAILKMAARRPLPAGLATDENHLSEGEKSRKAAVAGCIYKIVYSMNSRGGRKNP